jgi:dipeptidyl aminopeptidase/acylaminoacyl peptidase
MEPNGQRVAYAIASWGDENEGRKTDLWIVSTAGNDAPKQLTADRANDRSPAWHGTTVYFLGNRKKPDAKAPYDGKTQLWRVPAAGGDVEPVTQIDGGIAAYDIDRKTGTIIVQTDTTVPVPDGFSELRAKFPLPEYGHGKRVVSVLHRVDPTTKALTKLVDAKRYIREFKLAPGGTRIAMVTAFDDTVLRSEGESRVDVWEDQTVTTPPKDCYRKDAASPHAWLEDLAWNKDGTAFAFCAIFDGYPAEVVLGEKSDEWTTRIVKRSPGVHVRGYGSPIRFLPNGTPTIIAEANGKSIITPMDEKAMSLIPKSTGVFGYSTYTFDVDDAGKVGVAVMASTRSLGDMQIIEWMQGGQIRKRFDLNPHTASWAMPSVKHVTWKAKDGTTVGGVLELPAIREFGKPLPLVVAMHGGPTTSTKACLEFDPHNGRLYFAAKGYAVLLPNYRGSTGYGDKHVTDLIGNENDVDVSDIVAGVESLIEQKIADPNRIAVMGWSNGGYLTNCLITKKDLPFKIKAASSGAGILDSVVEWGANDEPAYVKVLKKGHPWESPDVHRKSSPTYGLGNVTTPTLIHVGGNDERCPPVQSRMLYRALREYVNVPTELLVYPGEPHGLGKRANRLAKMEWDLAWFEKYVK